MLYLILAGPKNWSANPTRIECPHGFALPRRYKKRTILALTGMFACGSVQVWICSLPSARYVYE
jgi:hypothetical protein